MIDKDALRLLFTKTSDAKRWARKLDITPVPVRRYLTTSDIKNKYMYRFFVRPVNDITNITEVDEVQYNRLLSNPRFSKAKVKWVISGRKETLVSKDGIRDFGVEDNNRSYVSQADLTFGGLTKYITDYTEFWVSDT